MVWCLHCGSFSRTANVTTMSSSLYPLKGSTGNEMKETKRSRKDIIIPRLEVVHSESFVFYFRQNETKQQDIGRLGQ